MLFPHKDEVLEIHRRLMEQFGGRPGLRDEGALDSALMAPANRVHYEAAGLAICAATYAFHLTSNHPFVDGNNAGRGRCGGGLRAAERWPAGGHE